MKPSQRIREIHLELEKSYNDPITKLMGFDDTFHRAVLNFLDEEYERNKPCEHKSAYQVDQNDVYYNVCNDCGILFLSMGDVKE